SRKRHAANGWALSSHSTSTSWRPRLHGRRGTATPISPFFCLWQRQVRGRGCVVALLKLQGARRLVVRRQLAVLVEVQPQQLARPASRRDGDLPGEMGGLDDAAALEPEQLGQRVGKEHAARGG